MRAPCPGWWHLGVRVAGVPRGLLSSGGRWRGARGGSWSRSALFVTGPSSGCGSPAGPEAGKKRGNKPLKEWTLIVSPFGQLKVRLPCHVTVSPLDPLRYPEADRALVTVSGVDSSLPQGVDLDRLQVKYDEALKEMTIVSDRMDSKAAVVVKTPMKFDLDIKTSGTGCVKIQKIDCDSCRIETEKGTSILQSIKSHKIHVRTKGGKVICLGTLHGNADIHAAEKSSVNIEKLQGTSIKISTEDGLLKTKYLYAESSFLSSTAGDILLGSIHGDTALQTKTGNITVDSSDGCLKASTHEGAIDVYVSQVRKVDLKSQKGSITVKVPASLKAYLQLSGSKVDVSSEIQLQETQCAPKEGHITITGHMNQINERDKWIKADTQDGTVYLKSQSWFQSIKLQVP
ncbi:protein FAM185A isoform X1 [Dermochelys coriacea]|uniref:protein FAM185A isoform X1 n=1 Tax=Dermochelys coriacea TaxID=27794 RepID=UPI0018E6FCC9|nr:protein FAM185A isoform X1 [Dermochelys coriacea]